VYRHTRSCTYMHMHVSKNMLMYTYVYMLMYTYVYMHAYIYGRNKTQDRAVQEYTQCQKRPTSVKRDLLVIELCKSTH
jgi:hypothetical protein